MRKASMALALMAALAGCSSTPSPKEIGYVEQARATAPTCTTDAQCAATMAAIKDWLGKMKFAPLERETPTELRTFERGSYWSVTPTAVVELKPVDATTRAAYARFGLYTPGQAPVYDPRLYKMVAQMNADVTAALKAGPATE